MKKAIRQSGLPLLLALSMLFSLLPSAAFAASDTVQPPSGVIEDTEKVYDSGYWGSESSNVAWVEVNGGKKLYVFPLDSSKNAKLPTGSVQKTNQGAPSNYSSVTEVVVCEGISKIGGFQFYQWSSLAKLSLPESLSAEKLEGEDRISPTVFNQCSSLTEVSIGKCAAPLTSCFANSPLETVTVDPGNTAYKISDSALLSKDGKTFHYLLGSHTEYTVPDGVTTLPFYVFQFSPNLTKLHLPSTLGSLRSSVFVVKVSQGWSFTSTYPIENIYLPQDLTTLRLDISQSDISKSLNIYYPGTAAEFQDYKNGASYITARGSLDNFFFNGSASPARKILWKDTKDAATVRKTLLASPGESITLPEDATGFTAPESGSFQGGFYFDGALKPKGSVVTMPDHDVTLYPNWFNSAVTVTLDPNGHGNPQNTQLTLESDGSATYGSALPTLTASNYTFLGWFTDPTDGTQVTADTVISSGDHTLYAHWQENPKITVTLDLGDGNGLGSVAPDSFQVYSPGKYPDPLPTPAWTDHLFNGWFTQSTAGSQVKGGDALHRDADHTLYAQWTAITDVEITLEPGEGASVTPDKVSAKYPGGAYPELAVPTRPGYTFLGWFTQAEEGEQVQKGDKLTLGTPHSLYAHWEKTPETYTLTLDPGAGLLSSTTLSITEGKPYPFLPYPTRAGYDFTGWFSEKSGGQQVTSGSPLLQNGDHTLYARYVRSVAHDNSTVLNYSFSFSNSARSFDYPADYHIPLERFKDVFGDNARARSLYEFYGPWGGSCSGMATASALFYLPNPTGKEIRVTDFKEGPWQGTASTLYEKITDMRIYAQHEKWRYSLRSFIEGMQISQGGTNSDVFSGAGSSIQGVFDLVQQETSGPDPKPVYLSIRRPGGGHALLAYEAKVISTTQAYLYVYDCNYPKDGNRYVILTKSDPLGSYDSFLYRGGYVYDLSLTARAFRSEAYPDWLHNIDNKPPLDALMNLICAGARPVKIVDVNGNVVAIVNGDGTTTTANGVEQLLVASDRVNDNGQPVEPNAPVYAFLVPTGQYTITDISGSNEDMKVSVSNIDRSATVQTGADSLTVIVDDAQDVNYVKIEDSNADYKIVLANSSAGENNAHYVEHLLTGKTGTAPTAIARKGGQTLSENVDLSQPGVTLSTRVDAQVYHDVDLDAIAAECENADDYEAAFAQKAAQAVAEARAADEAQPPMDAAWNDATDEEKTLHPITDGSLGTYRPVKAPTEKPSEPPTEKPTEPSVPPASSDSNDDDDDDDRSSSASHKKPSTAPKNKPNQTAAATQAAPKESTAASFLDVTEGAYYYSALSWAADKGIIKGITDTSFGPENSCTRGMIVTMLYRAMGQPKVTGQLPFRDVPAHFYYYDTINWAYQKGIVNGVTEKVFEPDSPCTRAQVVTMLYRAAGQPKVTGELPFRDVSSHFYYYDAINWAYQNGIVNGVTENTFAPDATCTRAMITAILYRAADHLTRTV